MDTFQDPPPYRWRDIRVFISSTFRDFHAERDHLVKLVFPRLREWAEEWKLNLVDIDLRWGVTAHEVETGQALAICLDEVDSCRPFFVCLLGERYGWVPDPDALSQETRAAFPGLEEQRGRSVTELEIRHAAFSSLRVGGGEPRQAEEVGRAFFYLRDPRSVPAPEELTGVSPEQRRYFHEAFYEPDPARRGRLAKLKRAILSRRVTGGSAEAGARAAGLRAHTYRAQFDPELANSEDDRLQGRLRRESLAGLGELVFSDLRRSIAARFSARIEALSRQATRDPFLAERELHDTFASGRTVRFVGRSALLTAVHGYLRGSTPTPLAVLGAPGSGKSALVAMVFQQLQRPGEGAPEVLIAHFVGATSSSTSTHSMLRRLCDELLTQHLRGRMEEELAGVPPLGPGADESAARDHLRALEAVRERYRVPDAAAALPATLGRLLGLTAVPVVVLIDGVNQLDAWDADDGLGWLPTTLPPNVRIVVSAVVGSIADVLSRRTPTHLKVGPLEDDERRELIRSTPSVFCKRLDEEHIRELESREETRNPLFLQVVLEELRVFGSFEKLGERVRAFPSELVSLFEAVLERLERDLEEHVPLIEETFCLLECSRHGLRLTELRDLLDGDEEQLHQGILRQLRSMLVRRGLAIDFFHRSLSKAVRRRYLHKGGSARWHEKLACYFGRAMPPASEEVRLGPPDSAVRRALFELPWQLLRQGDRWDELAERLGGIAFVEAKIQAGMLEDLRRDLREAMGALPEAAESAQARSAHREVWGAFERALVAFAESEADRRDAAWAARERGDSPLTPPSTGACPVAPPARAPISLKQALRNMLVSLGRRTRGARLESYTRFVETSRDALRRFGDRRWFVTQHAVNTDRTPMVGVDAKAWLDAHPEATVMVHPWGFREVGVTDRPVLTGTLTGHTDHIHGLRISVDGQRALSVDATGCLKWWDLEESTCLLTLEAGRHINRMCASADAAQAVCVRLAWQMDRWLLESGRRADPSLSTRATISAVALTPDASLAACVEYERRVSLWNLREGGLLFRLQPQGESKLTAIDLSADGQTVVVGAGSRLVVLRASEEPRYLETGDSSLTIRAVWVAADGSSAVIVRGDRLLAVWDLSAGLCVREHRTRERYMDRLTVSADGSMAVVASSSRAQVWDLARGEPLGILEGVGLGFNNGVALSGDGARLLSASNRALHVWDVEHMAGDRVRQVDAKKPIVDAGVTADGRRAILVTDDAPPEVLDTRHLLSQDTVTASCDLRYLDLAGSGAVVASRPLRRDSVVVWRPEDGRVVSTLSPGSWPVLTATLTPDEARVLVGTARPPSCLTYWDVASGARLADLRLHNGAVDVACSPSGRFAVSAGRDALAVWWDLDRGAPVAIARTGPTELRAVRMSPCGRLAVTRSLPLSSSEVRPLNLWRIHTGERHAVVVGGQGGVRAEAFSPDGRHVASAWSDGAVLISAVTDGRPVLRLDAHEGGVTGLHYGLDGATLLTGGVDRTVRMWDIATGECVGLCCVNGQVTSLSPVRPNGLFSVTTGRTGDRVLVRCSHPAQGPGVLTARRLWTVDSTQRGAWADRCTARCPWCLREIGVPPEVLEAAEDAQGLPSEADSPCVHLDPEAWRAPELQQACPECGRALRFNPFVVDNAAWAAG